MRSSKILEKEKTKTSISKQPYNILKKYFEEYDQKSDNLKLDIIFNFFAEAN